MNPESKSHCESTEHLLSAFALGEATEAEKEIVNAHVASCSACREQLALLSKTAQLVAQSAPQGVELKSVQRQRILDAARQAKLTASSEQRKPRTSRRILTLSLLSVAALALCGLGIWIFHESNQNAARDVAWRQDAGRATQGTAPADALAAHELSGEAARNAELLNEELRRTPKNDGLLSTQAAPTGGAGLALTDAERAAEATGIAGGVASDRPRELAAAASAVSGARDAYANFEKRALGEMETLTADQVARASDDKDHILAIAPTAGAPTRQDLAEVSRQQRPVLLRTTADTQGVPNDTPQSSLENVTNLSQDGSARGAQESLSDRLLARAPTENDAKLKLEAPQKPAPPPEPTLRLKKTSSLGVKEMEALATGARGPVPAKGVGAYGERWGKGSVDGEARSNDAEVNTGSAVSRSRRAVGEAKSEASAAGGARGLAQDSQQSVVLAGRPAPGENKDSIDLSGQALNRVHTFAPELDPTSFNSPSVKLGATDDYRKQPAGGGTTDGAKPAAPAESAPVAPATTAPAGPAPVKKAAQEAEVAERDKLSEAQPPPAAVPPAGAATVVTATPSSTLSYKQKVDEFLTRLDRRPGETPDMMFFRYWGDNPFTETASDHLSTFGVDVDTASYAITRAYLYKQGMLPPREAVRTEEFINYFAGGYAPPAEEGRPFSIHAEAASTPFAHESEYKLLRIGVKGREVAREKRKACSLVFVIDTSGSMRRENRLELVKDALRLLVPELDEGDSIGIVAFDFEARAVLEPVPASEREKILDAIGRLEPRRNTNVGAGLQLGFRMAASKLVRDGTNRVILLSDGVANTGVTDPNAMLEQVRAQRDLGVYLSTVGVGMGNLNDTLLEQLADRGNGRCVYVDRIEEAKKAFVEGLTGTLETIAKDVKIQVDFDPEKVLRYRLLGYENRAIADADFRNDRVDAGEVGAGHEVTALYELKLKTDAGGSLPAGRVATVHVRNKTPDFGEAQEVERVIDASSFKASFAEAAPRFRLQACAAEFAEVLRDSYWARGGSLGKVATTLSDLLDLRQSENGPRLGDDPDVLELLALVKRADALVQARDAQKDDVARTVDAIKENRFLQARVEQELLRRGEEQRNQLDEIRHQNDLVRRRLEDLLAR